MKPAKAAVEALSSCQAMLITSEAVIQFLLVDLCDGGDLEEQDSNRVLYRRRTLASTLLQLFCKTRSAWEKQVTTSVTSISSELNTARCTGHLGLHILLTAIKIRLRQFFKLSGNTGCGGKSCF